MKISTLFRGVSQWLNPVTLTFILVLLLLAVAASTQAQNVNFPDANFKAALLAHNPVIDTNNDDEISQAEASSYTGVLSVANKGIADLTGIGAFTSLTQLLCNSNNLTSLDVSSNTELVRLNCGFNSSLGTIDLSNNPMINNLDVSLTGISSIDLTQLPNLELLNIRGNSFISLDISAYPNIEYLNASSNDIDLIDLSANVALNALYLSGNPIDELNLSQNPDLTFFEANNTNISSIDLSSNPNLSYVSLQNNSNLTLIDIRNGNNEAINTFNSSTSANIECLAVDNVYKASQNWTVVDLSVIKMFCDPDDIINIPDTNFKTALLANVAINTLDDGEIRAGEAQAFSGSIQVNRADGIVSDLSGVEYFTNLEVLTMISHDISEFDATNHPMLRNLILPGNNLTEIDITASPRLTFVNLNDNEIASINVDDNVNMRNLKLNNNLLTQIDVTKLTLLTELTLGDNNLTQIDVTENPDLVILDAYGTNNLSAINISQNTALKYLNLSGNSLTSIDVTDQPDLLELSIKINQLTSLDLSMNAQLEEVDAQSNNLTSVNLANGNNTAITSINISDNEDLACVLVDNQVYSETNWSNDFDEGVSFSDIYCDPNTPVNIPDAIFKAGLLANDQINTTNDSEITYGEAEAYTGNIIFNSAGISDATGIEAFKNIFRLQLPDNNISEIDITNNTNLTSVTLNGNPITDLDVTQNINLISLSIGGTNLTSIDLSKNTLLKEIYMNDNLAITSLDLSQNPLLEEINAKVEIAALDLSDKSALRRLILFNTDINTLDLSNNGNLTFVNLQDNNSLASLNIRNGNNELLSAATSFRSVNNPSLSCIRVDNSAYSAATWTNVDEGVEFKLSCDPNDIINIPDGIFKTALLANTSINTLDDGEIRVGEAEAFSGTIQVNRADGIVSDLTGIEYFSNLEVLIMIDHDISEFDATNHPALRNIILPGNNLSEIDITANPNLTFVNLGDNQIGSIDVENNVRIRDLKLSDNLLTEIDVTNLPLLRELTLGDNELTEINITQNPALVILDGYRNNLGSIDITQNTALKYLNLFETNITSIDVSDQPDLLNLSVGNNEITSLDLSLNAKLEDLRVINAQLNTLDLSVNDQLEVLLAQNNSLNSLNLANGNNSAIRSINISDNQSLTCITVDDVAYAEANFTNIDEVANFSLDCSNISTDITDFSLTEQVAPAVIDATAHTVLVEVPVDTDLSSLVPTITVSVGATIDPETAAAQDFTSIVSYTVTAQNPNVSQEWLVTIREENKTPTAIELDNNTITEGNTIGALVGGFTSTDADAEDVHTYSLVAGEGDTDNAAFDVSESNLVANAVFNFDTQTSYSIRIRSDDGQGGTFEEQFTISILDFNKSNQTITFPTITDKAYGDDGFNLEATASSGLVVSYTIIRGDDLVSLSGNRLTIVGTGEITIRAEQAGNATFNPSSSVQRSFTVDPASITVTAENKQMTYGGDLPELTVNYSGFVGDEDATDLTTVPTIFTTATATSNVGDFAITASNAEADNYTFIYVSGTLSIGKAPLTVTADDQMKLYGADVPALTVDYDGFVNGDSEDDLSTLPVASTPGSSTSAVGEYTIAVAEAVSTNYDITYVPGKLTITPAMLTITADDQSMVYGSEVPQLTYSVDGYVNGDDASIVTTLPTVTSTVNNQSGVGTYDIIIEDGDAPNYSIQYLNGIIEVTKATIMVVAEDYSVVFGDDFPVFTYSLNGFVNNDDMTVLNQLPTVGTSINKGSDAGTYALEVSGGSDENYDFSYENGELVITKATAQIIVGELEFTADGQPKLPTITTDPEGLEVEVSINEGKDAPTEAGVYEIVIAIVDPNYEGELSGTLTITEPNALGIEQEDLPTVFPNPTRHIFTIGKEASEIDRLVLFDLNGRKQKQAAGTNQIDVSDQHAGVYLLWVYDTTGNATYQKVIKRD